MSLDPTGEGRKATRPTQATQVGIRPAVTGEHRACPAPG
jgi:hypothetical protein